MTKLMGFPTSDSTFTYRKGAKNTSFMDLLFSKGIVDSYSLHKVSRSFPKVVPSERTSIATEVAIVNNTESTILEGVDFLKCYIDDVLVHSKGLLQHLAHLEKLFKRLHEVNMKIHPKKCEFVVTSIVYLGHKIFAKWYYGSLGQSSSHFGNAQSY